MSGFFIERPVFAWVISICIMLGGIIAINTLPVEQYPRIAAPTINEVAIVMLFGLFGWKIAGLYIVTGLIIAIIGGFLIGRLKMER